VFQASAQWLPIRLNQVESGGDIEIGILKIVVSIINLKFIKES